MVVGSSPHLLAGMVARLLGVLLKVPFVFEVRDLWPSVLVELGALKRGSVTHRVLEWVETHLYRAARTVIVVPPGAGRRLEERGVTADKAVHVPNATTLPDDASMPIPPSMNELIQAAQDRDLLMYTGAHGVSNDLATVIRAMSRLRATDAEAYSRIDLILIGEGAERDRLRELAAQDGHGNVHFHPTVSKGALWKILERASILLVSFADAGVYDYGLSPNKLFDYMAVGRPVLLASRLTDTPVQTFDAGYTYVPGDPASLAERIRALLDLDPSERLAMGVRGRSAVRANYTIAATASAFETVLMDARRPTRRDP